VSGIPRVREWDAVVALESDAPGDESVFVALTDGRLLVRSGPDAIAKPAAAALTSEIEPPYRALALRREGRTWAVGAVAIEVGELPADTEGEELMLTVTQENEHALEVDGRPTLAGIERVEQAVGGRFEAYVLRATRLDGTLWEIEIDPL
jgi:hypothetical protein